MRFVASSHVLQGSLAAALSIAFASFASGQVDTAVPRKLPSRGSVETSAGVDTSVNFHTEIKTDTLASAGEIFGTIISATTGEPLKYVNVNFRVGAYRPPGTRTDSAGEFRFASQPEREVVLYTQRLGYKRDSITVDTRKAVALRMALRVNILHVMY